jgi:hypothetical protein
MYQSWFTLVSVAAAAALVGCATPGIQRPTKSAESDGSADLRTDTEHKPRKQRPLLVAPPPAYGNRVVKNDGQCVVPAAG